MSEVNFSVGKTHFIYVGPTLKVALQFSDFDSIPFLKSGVASHTTPTRAFTQTPKRLRYNPHPNKNFMLAQN